MAGIDSNSVLVCRMDGSGTSFVDSSPSHKTVTANGNATQATRKFNGTGAWFDGSVDTNMLFVPDSADWNFGSSAYTIESFVMFAPGDDGRSVIYEDYTDGSNYSRLEYSWAAGLWQYAISSGGGPLITAIQYSNTPNKSQWYHIAIVRNGTDVRMYLDGTSVGSTTATFTYPNYTAGLAIGGTTINSGWGLTGWLKEMRVSNSARYTSGFTPTTSQFTSDSNTKLLLHFDNALATGPLAPAIKFDGSGDYLSIADSADWDFGTGDYTIEGWFMWPGSMDNGYLIFRANGGGNVCDLADEVAMGAAAQICCYPMTGAEAKRSAVRGTVGLAWEIGRLLRVAREQMGDPFEALLTYLPTTDYYKHCRSLFDGRIVDLRREIAQGFTVGTVEIENTAQARISIQFRNEYLVARQDGKPVAIVPDLIAILDSETATPITAETLKYGQRVRVIGISAPPILRSEAALRVVGPQAFGFADPFRPIEEMA